MRVLVLIAGTNDPSNSAFLAEAFIAGMRSVGGVTVEIIRLKDLHINHFTLERYSPSCKPEDDFCRVQELLIAAHGVVIASPIWNFSVPGHLKNLIDRIGAFALDQETHSKGQLKGKPFYLLFTGGAPMIAWKALMYLTTLHLPEALKYYGGTICGKDYEPHCTKAKGQFGLVVSERPETLARMRRNGERFAACVERFAATGSLPRSAALRHRFFEFLYRIGNRIMYRLSEKQG
jgi:multimeric flavodoxin WrbA